MLGALGVRQKLQVFVRSDGFWVSRAMGLGSGSDIFLPTLHTVAMYS